MTSFWQDVRYSLRMIAKAPGYAAIAILTLALGIGANTTIFSWINSTLLNPIPGLASPNEVVALSLGRGTDNPFPFTYPDFEAMRDGQQSFAGIAACNIAPMSLTGKGKPERVWGMVASANYFDVLGVRPILGRGFLPDEDDKAGRRAGGGDQLPALANALRRESGCRRPDDRNQSAPLHDCRRNARGISGQPDRPALGNLDSDHDGRAVDAAGRPAS